jgi:hypothetical protein
MIRSILAVTVALGVSIPTLAHTNAHAATIQYLKPQNVIVKSINNAGYYEISPIAPQKYWGVLLALPAPPNGVKAIIYTLKGGTFSNGNTKLETSTAKNLTIISKQQHVYLYLNNDITLSYITQMIENNAIEQGKTTYVYPWHHELLLGDKADEKKLLNDLMHHATPSMVYLQNATVKATHSDTVFTFKYFETTAQLKVVKEKVKKILHQIIKPRMDVYQKEFAIHNWIATHVSYNFSKAGRNEQDYSALVAHKAACSGVTELTYQMLTAAGITNRMVPGNVHGGTYVFRGRLINAKVLTSDTAHIWNEVDLNGKWYMLDMTSDLANLYGGKINYNTFNLTSAQLAHTHTWNHAGLPIANTNFISVLQHSKSKQDQAILKVIQG